MTHTPTVCNTETLKYGNKKPHASIDAKAGATVSFSKKGAPLD
jgi:hypothetical protein